MRLKGICRPSRAFPLSTLGSRDSLRARTRRRPSRVRCGMRGGRTGRGHHNEVGQAGKNPPWSCAEGCTRAGRGVSSNAEPTSRSARAATLVWRRSEEPCVRDGAAEWALDISNCLVSRADCRNLSRLSTSRAARVARHVRDKLCTSRPNTFMLSITRPHLARDCVKNFIALGPILLSLHRYGLFPFEICPCTSRKGTSQRRLSLDLKMQTGARQLPFQE